jgi:uncharacterized protein YkwD
LDAPSLRRTSAAVALLLFAALLLASLAAFAHAGGVTRRHRLLRLTNEARIEHDRGRVSLVARLSRYAKRHSRAMADKGYLFHSDSSALQRALGRYDWSIGGENVGVGESVDSLQSAFMASRAHRRNVLRSAFDHTAIGMVRRGGGLWVTVIFYG